MRRQGTTSDGNRTVVQCAANHLTSFAVLADSSGTEFVSVSIAINIQRSIKYSISLVPRHPPFIFLNGVFPWHKYCSEREIPDLYG